MNPEKREALDLIGAFVEVRGAQFLPIESVEIGDRSGSDYTGMTNTTVRVVLNPPSNLNPSKRRALEKNFPLAISYIETSLSDGSNVSRVIAFMKAVSRYSERSSRDQIRMPDLTVKKDRLTALTFGIPEDRILTFANDIKQMVIAEITAKTRSMSNQACIDHLRAGR